MLIRMIQNRFSKSLAELYDLIQVKYLYTSFSFRFIDSRCPSLSQECYTNYILLLSLTFAKIMDRTIPSFRIASVLEENEWKSFKNI